jgi:hypothetical protein
LSKILFTPISVVSGLLAGLLGKKIFNLIWAVFDDEEPPKPEHRNVDPRKLALALVIDGTVFALIRGLVDHGSRLVFTRATGTWPGEEQPDNK